MWKHAWVVFVLIAKSKSAFIFRKVYWYAPGLDGGYGPISTHVKDTFHFDFWRRLTDKIAGQSFKWSPLLQITRCKIFGCIKVP